MVAVTCHLSAITSVIGCADWNDDVPYDWLRSGQPVSSAAVLQEHGFPAEDISASFDASVQDVEGSTESHSHIIRSMMQLASDQGMSAKEDTGKTQGTDTNAESTAADDHAPTDKTQPGPCEAEARHAASPQIDTHQTDREKATCAARAVSRASAARLAFQVLPDPLQAADKTSGSADIQATPTTDADMKETLASPQQPAGALEATRATGLADNLSCSADSNDPKDPYSISFKLQPWPLKMIML